MSHEFWVGLASVAGGIVAVITATLAIAKFPPTRFIWTKLFRDPFHDLISQPARQLTVEHIAPMNAKIDQFGHALSTHIAIEETQIGGIHRTLDEHGDHINEIRTLLERGVASAEDANRRLGGTGD